MDSSDDSIVAASGSLTEDIFGKKAAQAGLNIFGRKAFSAQKDIEDEEKCRQR